MVPNERLSYDRATGEATVTHVNAAEDTAWKRGDMCFRSENIHGIAKAIERKYGLNTYITSGKYDDMIPTAKFVHGETLDQIFQRDLQACAGNEVPHREQLRLHKIKPTPTTDRHLRKTGGKIMNEYIDEYHINR